MDVAFEVAGLRELSRSLRKVGEGLPKEIKDIHRKIAEPIADDARSRAPRRTGRLAGSIRTLSSQRASQVAAGRKGLDRRSGYNYAGRVHYDQGRSYTPFLTDALEAGQDAALDTYVKEIERFLDRVWESI